LTANPAQWAKTVLFATYDENGGFFDHVPPVTAPRGTPGEYITAPAAPDPTVVGNPPILGPIGLGFRLPTLIVSPFSRGGLVSSDRFDHTSVLRFLATRFGVEVPNLSGWRRAVVGDLTSAFNFAAPGRTVPQLPARLTPALATLAECAVTLAGTTSYTIPNPQSLPSQEPGTSRRPSGPC
jgi:phospholipase C